MKTESITCIICLFSNNHTQMFISEFCWCTGFVRNSRIIQWFTRYKPK